MLSNLPPGVTNKDIKNQANEMPFEVGDIVEVVIKTKIAEYDPKDNLYRLEHEDEWFYAGELKAV